MGLIKSKNRLIFDGKKKISYPIVGLIAATFVLIVIVGFLTFLNFERETKLLKDHLLRQGLTLIRAIEAGARSGMMEMMWGDRQVETLLVETAKGPNIRRILLVNENGQVLMSSNKVENNWQANYFRRPSDENSVVTFVLKESDGQDLFRIIRTFKPLSSATVRWEQMNCPPWMLPNRKTFIVLDLKMQEYQEAQKEDVRLAIISGIILFVVGSASFYFLLLAQNYYTVNRTLKTMESYMKNVVQSMPDGLISIDRKGRIQSINRSALRLLKLENESVKGKYLKEILPHCPLPEFHASQKGIYQTQVECKLNNETSIPLDLTFSQLKDEQGAVTGTVIILKDLRDIRTLEKQIERSERLASLGRMAAGIAHEIRNPLSSVKGFAQYFRNKFAPDSQDRQYATVMINEIDRLNRVIQELLEFAKPRQPKPEPLSVNQLLEHALQLVHSELKRKQIRVELEETPAKNLTIHADRDLMTQVLLNLFLNAIEALDEKGEIRIKVEKFSEKIVIHITDNGPGINPQHLRQIFDPFFTTKQGGTGLGLAIVHRIVEIHNAEIQVHNNPGQGTTFSLSFPMV